MILGVGESLSGKLLLYDALEMTMQSVHLRKNPACRVCGAKATVVDLIDYEQFCGTPARGKYHVEGIHELEPHEIHNRIQAGEPISLLDVRDPIELQVSRLPGARILPSGQVMLQVDSLEKNRTWVVFCRTGERSARVTRALMDAGLDVYNMKGGINAWAEQVEPTLLRY